MLNKRALKPVPNSTKLMSVFNYEATSETDKEIFEPDFLNVAATVLNVGDTVKLLKRGMDGEVICYLEYFILAVDPASLMVDFEITTKRIYDEKAFKFLEAKEKAKEVKENK